LNHANADGHLAAPGLTEADVRKAYERGKRDERGRRKSHPLISLAVLVAALLGAGMVFLAAREGSFARGGQVVDHKIAAAADRARLASQDAASAAQTAKQDVIGGSTGS
jgi:hypothetical protein